ncbi:MAG: hypothetical protein HOW73_06870 [Polyangiaceae bacterium]|nr:hypothetical protein [Polyangiaceae bacterium]
MTNDDDPRSTGAGNQPRVLRELIREAQLDAGPDLPWDRIEARLFAHLDENEPAAPPSYGAAHRSTPPYERAVETPIDVAIGQADVAATESHALPTEREPSILPAPLPKRVASARGERPSRWASARWVGVLAVAACFALVWASHNRGSDSSGDPVAVAEPIDVTELPMAPGVPGARDLSALKSGDVVEAAVGPVAFGEAGKLEWTLSAGGRLVVRDGVPASDKAGSTHVVELESGSMRGSLAPSTSATLVVMAGETQVVSLGPGSVFSVTRSSRRLVMHLEHGAASVGRRTRGFDMLSVQDNLADRRAFSAPFAAAFSLDGGNTYEVLPTTASLDAPPSVPAVVAQRGPEPVAEEAVEPPVSAKDDVPASPVAPRPATVASAPPAVASVAAASVAAASASPPVEEPKAPDADPAATVSDSAASSKLVSCIARVRNDRQAKAAEGVRIIVSSTLRASVGDDGSVKSAVFNPPLEPELQGCAVFLLRTKLQPGARVLSIPVSLP